MNTATHSAHQNNNNAGFPPAPSTAHQRACEQSQPTAKRQTEQQALQNALTQQSTANYDGIINGFMEKGLSENEIIPRVNVFTYDAWRAAGRQVKKGEHGIKIIVYIPCAKKITDDEGNTDSVAFKKPHTTTVFHISQTDPIILGGEAEAPREAVPTAPEAPESATDPHSQAPTAEPGRAPLAEVAAKPLNAYEQKIADRKARYQDRAADLAAQSNTIWKRARQMADVIPFGQPILVGHHSEGRDRRYRSRIHATYGKSVALQDKAEYYAHKAASVGRGGISSDDPDAIGKLQAELAKLEAAQAVMVKANKVIRTQFPQEAKLNRLVELGIARAQAEKLFEKDFCGRVGFPDYALTNNNANMSRIRKRIAELTLAASRADYKIEYADFVYSEDTAENRVMFVFSGKPDASTRAMLKDKAFNWSPNRNAWIRKLNNGSSWIGRDLAERLAGLSA